MAAKAEPVKKGRGRPKKTRQIDYGNVADPVDASPEHVEKRVLAMLSTTLEDYERLRNIHRQNIARFEQMAAAGELGEREVREFESQQSRLLRVTASQKDFLKWMAGEFSLLNNLRKTEEERESVSFIFQEWNPELEPEPNTAAESGAGA